MTSTPYIGRFAPSPTGPMHFGTLIAAVASYLQAKSRHGQWLVRIEDVDTLRNVAGADLQLLKSLEAYGFEWEGEVVYQTQRTALYADALEHLIKQQLAFPCNCSRKHLASIGEYQQSGVYPGTCRNNLFPYSDEHSIRMQIDDITITYTDAVLGLQKENLATECGDFVVRRRDGLFAYQLAVVVDDALQGITEIVRGADLLDSTARQIYLQQSLGYQTPAYMHIPLALGQDGGKLSKLTHAAAIDDKSPVPALFDALCHLGQNPPSALKQESIDAFWQWAIDNWNRSDIPTTNRQYNE